MTSVRVTKDAPGDGTHTETKTTTYPSGATKSVKSDATDRTLLGGDKVISVTRTNKNGNSETRKVR